MHRYLIIITAALIGAAGLAHAQQPAIGSVPSLVEVENEAMMVERFNLSVDQLEDMDIHGPGGERIGEIDDLDVARKRFSKL